MGSLYVFTMDVYDVVFGFGGFFSSVSFSSFSVRGYRRWLAPVSAALRLAGMTCCARFSRLRASASSAFGLLGPLAVGGLRLAYLRFATVRSLCFAGPLC